MLKGEVLKYILVTHTHRDHSPAAISLKKLTGAEIYGCRPRNNDPMKGVSDWGLEDSHDQTYIPDRILNDGDLISLSEASLQTLETPGHTANHLCFALLEEKALFTGDHVMGWSTTLIAPPDGSMRDYMRSLESLRLRDDIIFWPGHGAPIDAPQRYIRAVIHHRRARERAILNRLAAGKQTISNIVDEIYVNLNPRLRSGAEMTVYAHLIDLVERNKATHDGSLALNGFYRLQTSS